MIFYWYRSCRCQVFGHYHDLQQRQIPLQQCIAESAVYSQDFYLRNAQHCLITLHGFPVKFLLSHLVHHSRSQSQLLLVIKHSTEFITTLLSLNGDHRTLTYRLRQHNLALKLQTRLQPDVKTIKSTQLILAKIIQGL